MWSRWTASPSDAFPEPYLGRFLFFIKRKKEKEQENRKVYFNKRVADVGQELALRHTILYYFWISISYERFKAWKNYFTILLFNDL